ncbi:hypothetical protein ACLD9W_00045 [Neisseria sp. WLZKY-1]
MQRHLDDLYRTLTTRNLRIDESAGNGLTFPPFGRCAIPPHPPPSA